jgi:hydrogenase maturation factor
MIDPATRDIVQNVYIRRVEKAGNALVNNVIDTVKDVKDPTHKNGADRQTSGWAGRRDRPIRLTAAT